MSDAFKFHIELTPQAQKIVANLQTLPPRVINYVAAAMNKTNQLALANVKQRLVGVGPFPVEEHKLGRLSGSLYAGVRASDATIEGQVVDTSIGTNTTNRGFSYPAGQRGRTPPGGTSPKGGIFGFKKHQIILN